MLPDVSRDCFAFRAMTCLSDLAPRSAASFAKILPSPKQGRRECRAIDAPAGPGSDIRTVSQQAVLRMSEPEGHLQISD